MARIGFIGTGEIAAAMVAGLAGLVTGPERQGHRIYLSERNAKTAAKLAGTYTNVSVHSNQQVLDHCDTLVLCLMAAVADVELPKLAFADRHKVISVMVDVAHATLADLCAPATKIAIAIPLPMIATGGCPLPVYGDAAAVVELFGGNNLILPQASEDALNAHFAACALGSVVLAQMQEAADWLTGITGEPVAAEAYMSRMITGYLNAFSDDKVGQYTDTLNALSAEGGLNATLRAKLEQGGALDDIRTGLDQFRGRLGLPPAE